jgi:Arc/MetJ-type ribon-helix-helix transcriptional regulator
MKKGMMKLGFRPKRAKAHNQLEVLIAMGLYKSRSEAIRDHLRQFLAGYKDYLMPIAEVKKFLAMEIPQEHELSEDIIAMRKREIERYLEG